MTHQKKIESEITIIGGGIAGLTTAIALNKLGIKTTIFEASSNVGSVGAGLGLAANAILAFERLGIKEKVIEKGRVLGSFTLFDQKGKVIQKTDSEKLNKIYGVNNFTIHRHDLHQVLLSCLPKESILVNKRLIDLEQQRGMITLLFQDGTKHQTKHLIVADGIHSPIRKKIVPASTIRYAGYTCWRAVIDSTNLNITESSETWGNNGRFGIVPLANHKLYWFACVNANQNDGKYKNFKTHNILDHFKDFHNPIPDILRRTDDSALLWNDIIDLEPMSKYAFGNTLFVGDAAHATTPNMGQGACQAIEDAVVLADEIQKNTDIKTAFTAFEKRRLNRLHYITNASWQIGKIAQLENPILTPIRNFLFRILPASFNEKNIKRIYDVDFK